MENIDELPEEDKEALFIEWAETGPLKEFFSRPGINKSGFCRELGVSQRFVNGVIKGDEKGSEKFYRKIIALMKEYGYDYFGYKDKN
jgi:hypothetical protein